MLLKQPATASSVAFSGVELDGREVRVPITVTWPTEETRPKPGIVLFPEIFGCNDFILEVARDLAELGYVVATPDLYHRTAVDSPISYEDLRLALKLALSISPDSSAVDADAALRLLKSRPDVDAHRLATMGYCVGGLLSYTTAARHAGDIRACVIFYASGLIGRTLHPRWPDDLLQKLGAATARVRMFYGAQDDHIPCEYVRALDSQMDTLGIDVRTTLYQEVGHGFCNSHLPTYSARAARDAWLHAMNFLGAELNPSV